MGARLTAAGGRLGDCMVRASSICGGSAGAWRRGSAAASRTWARTSASDSEAVANPPARPARSLETRLTSASGSSAGCTGDGSKFFSVPSVSSFRGLKGGISSWCAPPASRSGAESREKALTLMTSRPPARMVVGVRNDCFAVIRSTLRMRRSPLRAATRGRSALGCAWRAAVFNCGRLAALRILSCTPTTAAAIRPAPDRPVSTVAVSQRALTRRRSSMACRRAPASSGGSSPRSTRPGSRSLRIVRIDEPSARRRAHVCASAKLDCDIRARGAAQAGPRPARAEPSHSCRIEAPLCQGEQMPQRTAPGHRWQARFSGLPKKVRKK